MKHTMILERNYPYDIVYEYQYKGITHIVYHMKYAMVVERSYPNIKKYRAILVDYEYMVVKCVNPECNCVTHLYDSGGRVSKRTVNRISYCTGKQILIVVGPSTMVCKTKIFK